MDVSTYKNMDTGTSPWDLTSSPAATIPRGNIVLEHKRHHEWNNTSPELSQILNRPAERPWHSESHLTMPTVHGISFMGDYNITIVAIQVALKFTTAPSGQMGNKQSLQFLNSGRVLRSSVLMQ